MSRIQQTLLIALLGFVGAMAGLGAALLVLGPGALLQTPIGQWTARHILQYQAFTPDGRRVITPGLAVPPLPVQNLDTQPHQLSTEGRPLLINYWASWCGPCVKEMPLLSAFAESQGENGIRVVGIALDEPADVHAFLKKQPVTFPIYLEPPGPNDSSVLLGNARGILPYSVLINPDGTLRKTKLGAFSRSQLEAWVKE